MSAGVSWPEMEAEPDPSLFAELEAAAGIDAGSAELLAEYDERRYETRGRLARRLRRRGHLRRGLTSTEAADVIWTLASERTVLALVRARSWSPARYERWLAQQLVAALL